MFEERKGEKQARMATLVLDRMWPHCGRLGFYVRSVLVAWVNEVGYPELRVDWIALV